MEDDDITTQPSPEPADSYAPVAHDERDEDLGGDWDEPRTLPPRPRRRLLTPLPVALVCVLLTACGFIAGVLVEKGQGSTGSSAGTTGGRGARGSALRGLGGAAGAIGAGGAGGASAQGGAVGGAGASATLGQVTFVQGGTLYVTNAEGNTVKVHTTGATTVTKSVSSSTKAIHPGETVVVSGAATAAGTVDAESIRVGGGSGGIASLFGAGGSKKAGGGGGAGGEGGPTLFGPG